MTWSGYRNDLEESINPKTLLNQLTNLYHIVKTLDKPRSICYNIHNYSAQQLGMEHWTRWQAHIA
jgi:hypothetical protein